MVEFSPVSKPLILSPHLLADLRLLFVLRPQSSINAFPAHPQSALSRRSAIAVGPEAAIRDKARLTLVAIRIVYKVLTLPTLLKN